MFKNCFMRKRLIYAILLSVVGLGYGQQLPVLVPPTPEAASLGKNIEIPVSLSTGVPNITIPLWEIRQGDILIPIGLSYNSSGIKVEEIASWVGTGWNLNFGGGIFRSSRGLPDDVNGGFLTVTGDRKIDQFNSLTGNRKNDLIDLAINNQLDYQPDIFNFSILGYSGKFFFEQNTKQILMFSKSDVKIEPIYEFPLLNKNILEWKVTLPNGVQCFFGENKAYDSSVGSTFTSGSKNGLNIGSRNAWYITRIVDTYGETISYTYKQTSRNVCRLSSQGESYTPTKNVAACNLGLPQGKYSVYYSGVSIGARIKEIVSKTAKIVFTADTSNRQDYSQDQALKKVEIFQNGFGNNLITSFNFTYFYTTNSSGAITYPSPCVSPSLDELSKRLFLSTIQQKKGSNVFPPHKMYYNQITLPSRTSYAQDYWGYYNGATNNTTLVPEVYIPNYWSPDGPTLHQSGANRKVAARYAKAGILEKIIYPTGGSSEFAYEGNKATNTDIGFTDFLKDKDNIMVEEIVRVSNRSDFELGNPTTYIVEKKFIVNKNSCTGFSKDYPHEKVDKIFVQSSYPCNGGKNDCKAIIYLDQKELQFDGSRICIELTPGEHELSYMVIPQNLGGVEPNFHATITREYEKKVAGNSIIGVGGLRIKEIKHSPLTGNPIIKKYEYFNGSVLNMPVYGTVRMGVYQCRPIPTAIYIENVIIYEKRSYSSTPLLTANGNYVMYQNVHEYTVDEITGKKNGVSKSSFSFEKDIINRSYPFEPPLSLEWKRGNLLKKEHYKIDDNNTEQIVGATEYIYGYKNRVNQIGLFPVRLYMGNIPNSDYLVKSFRTEGESKILIGEKKIEFHNGVRLNTDTKYFYDSPKHLLKTRSVLTDSRGKKLITKTYYPDDVSSTSALGHNSLTTAQYNAVDRLKKDDLHRIVQPVQTETYKDLDGDGIAEANELLSVQRTNYSEPFSGMILPKEVQTLKGIYHASGNPLEDRIVYHSYYANGNVKEVSKKDGTRIVYIWGYNGTVPIAKIENATFSSVQTAIATLNASYNTLAKIQGLSDADNDRTIDTINPNNGSITKVGSEGNLREALRDLRNALSNAMITSFTYDPLVGVTSITDPRGQVIYYKYDAFNRLSQVVDKYGHIVSENQYNYKN